MYFDLFVLVLESTGAEQWFRWVLPSPGGPPVRGAPLNRQITRGAPLHRPGGPPSPKNFRLRRANYQCKVLTDIVTVYIRFPKLCTLFLEVFVYFSLLKLFVRCLNGFKNVPDLTESHKAP